MDIKTDLLLPYMTFKHWDASGREVSVLIVKGTFMIRVGERLKTMRPQPELLLSDVYHGDPWTSSMRQEGDLAPYKPKTNVTFNAVARSPGAVARASWPVRFTVKDAPLTVSTYSAIGSGSRGRLFSAMDGA